jgi:hypothetical protein
LSVVVGIFLRQGKWFFFRQRDEDRMPARTLGADATRAEPFSFALVYAAAQDEERWISKTYKLAKSRTAAFDDARLASIWLGRHVDDGGWENRRPGVEG